MSTIKIVPNFSYMRRVALAGIAAASILVAGCGNDSTTTAGSPSASESVSESASASESPESPVDPAEDLSGITVEGEDAPEVTVPTPWGIAETQSQVVKESDNPQVLTDTSTVTLNYHGVNGRTGEVFDSSFESGQPATFSLQQVVPGFQKGLAGQHVGSRVLIGVAPEDGYPQGQPPMIEPGDSLIFVVDIISADYEEAMGEEVTPEEGLPTVEMTDEGPEVTMPEGGEAPEELVVQPLIKGDGPPVTENATISVKFRTWNYGTGEMIEDGWHPQQGPLNSLIEGWKEGLKDQPSGSRVMLVVPPDKAYPDGNPANPEVEPGQTLVYVIDILYVTEQPQ